MEPSEGPSLRMLSGRPVPPLHPHCVQVSNRGEAALLVHIAAALTGAGLPPADIGAISPYRAQVCSPTCLHPRHVE